MDLKQYISAFVRIFGTGLVVWLAAKGKISTDEATSFIVTVLWVVANIAWSFVNKRNTGDKIDTALELPAGSSHAQLKDAIKNGVPTNPSGLIGCIVVLFCLLLTTACPITPDSIAKVKSASKKVATAANTGVNLTRELYNANFLTIEQKDVIAQKFLLLAKAGIAFDTAVASIENQYGANAVPKSEIQRLVGVFDAQVVNAFLDVLTSLKIIPSKGNYGVTIELIRTGVLTVAGILGLKHSVSARIKAAA